MSATPAGTEPSSPLGLIAGNGRFPLLVVEEARRRSIPVVVVAVRGEADPALADAGVEHHWVRLGQLGRCIRLLKRAGVRRAVMAGQVRHRKAFVSLVPDATLLRVLRRLEGKSTEALLRAVADVLAEEGIELVDSTWLLRDALATEGVLGVRRPTASEWDDVAWGAAVARDLARRDIGQTVVVKDRAVVAVEAMEGTDETIARAGRLVAEGLVVVKLARPSQDMRYDVPVAGPGTIEAMRAAGARCLAVEAGRTLLLDKERLLRRADELGIAVVGIRPTEEPDGR